MVENEEEMGWEVTEGRSLTLLYASRVALGTRRGDRDGVISTRQAQIDGVSRFRATWRVADPESQLWFRSVQGEECDARDGKAGQDRPVFEYGLFIYREMDGAVVAGWNSGEADPDCESGGDQRNKLRAEP